MKTTKGTWVEPRRILKSQGKYLPSMQRSAHGRFIPPRDALEQHLSGREGGRMGLVEKLSFQAAAAETSADPPGSSEGCPESGQGFQACIALNGTVTGSGLSPGRGRKLG